MPATIDTAHTVTLSGHQAAATPLTGNLTCAAADNCLIMLVGCDQATTAAPPSILTYNGVGMTFLGSISKTNNYLGNSSVWYMFNPPTGSSLPISATFANNWNAGIAAIPMSGVNTGLAPVIGTGSTGTSAAASCVVSGAGANDLQLATLLVRSTALSSTGANQAVVPSTPTLPVLSINTLDSFSGDYIAGANAGNFSWSLTNNDWAAIGVKVFGTASGPQYITKWTPFRWACAMRSLQQGANNVGNRQQNRAALLASAITNANGAATWAKWRVGENSRVSSCGLVLNVPLVPGFVPPVGTVDDGT